MKLFILIIYTCSTNQKNKDIKSKDEKLQKDKVKDTLDFNNKKWKEYFKDIKPTLISEKNFSKNTTTDNELSTEDSDSESNFFDFKNFAKQMKEEKKKLENQDLKLKNEKKKEEIEEEQNNVLTKTEKNIEEKNLKNLKNKIVVDELNNDNDFSNLYKKFITKKYSENDYDEMLNIIFEMIFLKKSLHPEMYEFAIENYKKTNLSVFDMILKNIEEKNVKKILWKEIKKIEEENKIFFMKKNENSPNFFENFGNYIIEIFLSKNNKTLLKSINENYKNYFSKSIKNNVNYFVKRLHHFISIDHNLTRHMTDSLLENYTKLLYISVKNDEFENIAKYSFIIFSFTEDVGNHIEPNFYNYLFNDIERLNKILTYLKKQGKYLYEVEYLKFDENIEEIYNLMDIDLWDLTINYILVTKLDTVTRNKINSLFELYYENLYFNKNENKIKNFNVKEFENNFKNEIDYKIEYTKNLEEKLIFERLKKLLLFRSDFDFIETFIDWRFKTNLKNINFLTFKNIEIKKINEKLQTYSNDTLFEFLEILQRNFKRMYKLPKYENNIKRILEILIMIDIKLNQKLFWYGLKDLDDHKRVEKLIFKYYYVFDNIGKKILNIDNYFITKVFSLYYNNIIINKYIKTLKSNCDLYNNINKLKLTGIFNSDSVYTFISKEKKLISKIYFIGLFEDFINQCTDSNIKTFSEYENNFMNKNNFIKNHRFNVKLFWRQNNIYVSSNLLNKRSIPKRNFNRKH